MAQAATTGIAVERWRRASPLDRITLYSTFGLLLFGPLAFGTTEPWSKFVLECGAVLLLLLWAFRESQSGELQITGNPLFFPMMAFAALILIQLLAGRTAYSLETLSMLRLYVAYGVLCFLVVQLLRRTAQVRNLAIALSVYGCALALFALIQGLSPNGKLYWIRTPRFGGWIYGPYVNHNHYAGLMELLVPIPLILGLSDHVHGQRKKMAIAAAAVMASSIFLSGSRGGMTAFVVELIVVTGFVLQRNKMKVRRSAMAIGLFVAIMIALLAWLGGSDVVARLASINEETQTELSGGTRVQMDRDALMMFGQKPATGWGLGVFPDVYPQFRSFSTNFSVNAAHNDYLQLLVEMGALGFALMLWFVGAMYRGALRKIGKWSSDTNGALALAALLGCTGILVHSFVDFNLQVPANAALFYVFAVLAAMEPRFGLARRRSERRADEIPTQRSA